MTIAALREDNFDDGFGTTADIEWEVLVRRAFRMQLREPTSSGILVGAYMSVCLFIGKRVVCLLLLALP